MLKQWSAVKEIYVACPGGFATGGTELLHQLVDVLRKYGKQAFIYYYERPEQGRPAVFDCYDAPQGTPRSDASHLIIAPETGTHVLRDFPRARKCLWWLSVDNYFAFYRYRRNAGFWRKLKELTKKPRAYRFHKDPDIVHLVQCEYARAFLADQGISSHFLGDYLRDDFLSVTPDAWGPKQNQVCFNPKKGFAFTRQLIELPDNWMWVELANMTPAQMRDVLLQSKVYIDFGHHPGKDRIPREAAMAGCVVITGCEGSAANAVDVPIADRFKIDQHAPGAAQQAMNVIRDALERHETVVREQDDYRARICTEKAGFLEDVKALFL